MPAHASLLIETHSTAISCAALMLQLYINRLSCQCETTPLPQVPNLREVTMTHPTVLSRSPEQSEGEAKGIPGLPDCLSSGIGVKASDYSRLVCL